MIRFVARMFLGALVLAAVAAALFVWRLGRGPIPLDVLVPRVRAALSGDGVAVDLGGLALGWDAEHRQLSLHASGFRMTRADGPTLAFDAVTLRLQKRALLHGRIAVTSIELVTPTVDLVRKASGNVVNRSGGAVLAELGAVARHVQYVAIRDGRMTLVDETSGARWDVGELGAWLWREDGSIRIQLQAALLAGEQRVPVWADATRRSAGGFELTVTSPGTPTGVAFGAWPAAAATEARTWVVRHISEGRVRNLALHLAGREAEGVLSFKTIDANLDFEDLAVRWLDGMPPATDVRGHAHFTRDGAQFAVAGGALDRLAIRSSMVTLAWPRDKPNRIAVDASTEGPLASALGVLDEPPIDLGRTLGIPPAGVSGDASVRVRVAFPLAGPHRLGNLGLDVTATLARVGIPNLMGDWSVADGNARVTVDDRGTTIDGDATVAGVPGVRVHGERRFADPASGRLEVAGRVDDAARARLGVDVSALRGPVDVIVRIGGGNGGRPGADVEADLTPAEVAFAPLVIDKPAGVPGRGFAHLTLARGVVTAVDDGELVVGGTVVHASAERPPAGGTWSRIDAEATLPPPPDGDEPGALTLAARADGDVWRVSLNSPDAGRVLRAYGRDTVRGGRLAFEGTVDPRVAGLPWRGRVTVDRTTLRGVPWLVRLVGLASVHGLFDRGDGGTVPIDRLVATLDVRPPVIELQELVANGPTLGFSLRGRVDQSTESLDLEGTLVPSYYLLNEAADRIPFVGQMIARATGGAVQAVAFTVRGTVAEPAVAVQPLASIAPGVLRDWVRKLGW